MRGLRIAVFVMISLNLMLTLALAAGDAMKGKALFNDPKFGGGTVGSVLQLMPSGWQGVEKAADRKDLEKQVNACIKNALKGKGIDTKSTEMADMVTYIKSLKGKAIPTK